MKTSLAEQFQTGFTIGIGYDTDEIMLDEKHTEGHTLAFLCYDANLFPVPNISTWKPIYRNRVLDVVREYTKSVNAEVWVDDVKVKDYVEARDAD